MERSGPAAGSEPGATAVEPWDMRGGEAGGLHTEGGAEEEKKVCEGGKRAGAFVFISFRAWP